MGTGMDVEVQRVTLSPRVVREVLWFAGDTNVGKDGGLFVSRLLQLLAAADGENRARLAKAFPEYAAGYAVMGQPWGIDWLRGLAKSMDVGDVEALDLMVDGRG